MAKTRTTFLCGECGAVHPKWIGRCPDCNAWDSLEAFNEPADGSATVGTVAGVAVRGEHRADGALGLLSGAVPLIEVERLEVPRVPSGLGELDRVLGGGFVPGSSVLLGGEPGIGKSTILLQAAASVCGAPTFVRNWVSTANGLAAVAAEHNDMLLPLDEIGRQMMVESTNKLSPDQPVSALIDQFKTDMKEFRIAMTDFQVRVGSPDNPLGKVAISHAAGTNGGYPIAKAYFDHGVDTVLYIHCSPQDTQKIKEEFEGKGKNLVISGHISSDAVGINVYCDELEKRGLEVTRISGILT